jgi:hypothetical protein
MRCIVTTLSNQTRGCLSVQEKFIYLANVLGLDLIAPNQSCQNGRGCQKLYRISATWVVRDWMEWIAQSALPEGGLLALSGKFIDHAFPEFKAFGVRTKLNDFGYLFARISIRLHDQTAENYEMETMRDSNLRQTGLRGRWGHRVERRYQSSHAQACCLGW